MKFEELITKIDEFKALYSDSIEKVILNYRAVPKIISDIRDSWSRVTKLFCPYCGLEQELIDNDSLCHGCGRLVNKDNYGISGQYRTFIFEDREGNKYVLSTYVTPEFSHNSLNICEVSKLTYEDTGYGFYSADGATKAVYSASGSKKQRSRNAYSYAEIEDFTGSGIWNVMPNNSRYWLFWDEVDNASTATKKKTSATKSPVYASIIFNKPENKDVANLLFNRMYEDAVTGITHYEVWCQHCGKLFETDLMYSENAVCPVCGAEDRDNLRGYSNGQLQINKNGDSIDIVKYIVRADDNFDVDIEAQCAFKIDAKGKTTTFNYNGPNWEKVSTSRRFNWGYVSRINVDPQLQDCNFEEFEKLYNSKAYHGRRCISISPMEVRRFFEGCQKNELVKSLVNDPLAMKVIIEAPELMDFKAKTPHELFRLEEDVYEDAHDNNVPLAKAKKIQDMFPAYSPSFYKLAADVSCFRGEYLEEFKDLVDSLTENEPEILEFFEQQKKDGLRADDAFESLGCYLNCRKTLGLDNIPELPEHILVEQQKLIAATHNDIYRCATEMNGTEEFKDHINEFTLSQIVSCYFVKTNECEEIHYSTNGPDLVITSENGEIIAIIEPDGTIK